MTCSEFTKENPSPSAKIENSVIREEVRQKKNLSQGDVAIILGVHRTYISGFERGARNPSLLTVQKVAKALGIDP